MKTPYCAAIVMAIVGVLILSVAQSSHATKRLTAADACRLAVEYNREYLSAREEVAKAQADITRVRAGALPDISLSSSYSRNLYIPSFYAIIDGETNEFKTGFKHSFRSSVSLTQSIWQGGKVFTALSIAKDYGKYSAQAADQVKASVICQAEVLFYIVILEQSRLAVLQKSFEASSYNLEVAEKFFSQGLVSEFELLRARVEKSNLQPLILNAESNLRLAEKRLKSFLGINLDEPVAIVEETTDTVITDLPSLTHLVDVALQKRPEILRARSLTDISRKVVKVARADYFPALSAGMSYSWSAESDAVTLRENLSRSWTAGLNLTIPIFRGGRTRGAVSQAIADNNQARLAEQQMRDDIVLEVEEAYDRLLQAKKALEIQGNTIAQAEEGLKIANLRYESGVGTQLEVLSAQAALTQAREILAEATFSFRTAKAGLKKATTIDIDNL